MGILSIFKKRTGRGTENGNVSLSENQEQVQNDPNPKSGIKGEENVDKPKGEESNPPKQEETPSPKKENLGENVEKGQEKASPEIATYNLIILDESGSMSGVRQATISGCNETLNSIRNTAKENKDIKQYVSIFCFDTSNSRYIFHDVPVEETRDLTMDDYRPNACTPLYDAIGTTVTQLSKLLADSESVGVVTIITDGMENASRRWRHQMVVELIDSLKKRGWVFTFIGANIDVEGTASGLGIDSHMQFDQSDEGMSSMFEADRRSRRAYSAKMNYLRRSKFFNSESAGSRRQDLGALNNGYFVEKERVAPMTIEHLGTDDIFVFFSNADGQHVDGASLYALNHFGAINGQAEGIQGKCYAIPIVGNTLDDIKAAFERFNEYVVKHPQFRFILTPTGWGTADINMELIAPLFRMAYSFGNVYVPKQFLPYVDIDINF